MFRLRLLEEHERVRFDLLLQTCHYLKSSRIGGRHLRYDAEVDGEWVALLSFSDAAPKLKGREKWIGWSPRQQARRLGLVCNNSRFLLLVQRERHPNLASKILVLALPRLARDWCERWGHEVLVVESFVAKSRYRGTCYHACGFESVGGSAGFSRDSRDYYTAHNQPKQLYLRELLPKDRKLLCRPRLPEPLREAEADIAFYASSHTDDERSDAQLLKLIVGHWDAIENRATLCNLAIGLCNLERKRGRTMSPSLPSWQRSMTQSAALKRVLG